MAAMSFSIKLATQLMLKGVQNVSGRNIVTSLLSINMLLNMLTVGTKGRTQKQLLNALKLDTAIEITSMSSAMMSTMNIAETVGGPTLSMAHGVWADHRLSFKPTFKDIVTDIYKGDIQTFDFANKPDQVVSEVNSWAEKETKGLIKNLLSRISRDAYLILANALYFKGIWRDNPFEKSLTKEDNFYLLNDETTKVPFMTSYKAQSYKFFEDYKLLKLPYHQSANDKTSEFSMYIFLPHEKNGLGNLLEKINSNPQLLHENKHVGVKALAKTLVPKFKFEYKFEPSDMMKEMGVDLPFKDLGEMDMFDTAVEEEKDRGSVLKIIQKSFIEVNEKGTEAAAVTAAILSNAGCAKRNPRPPPPEDFVADHPFFFMIKEDVSGSILFSGVVTNPLMP